MWGACVSSLLLSFAAVGAGQSYQLHDVDSSLLVGASPACLNAYNANVSCPNEIGWLYGTPYQDFDEDTLSRLCTDNCRSALMSHRMNIASSCGDGAQYIEPTDNTTYFPTALDDALLTAYGIACLKRSDGTYCNTWFQQNASSSASIECDECILGTAQLQASSPYEQDDGTKSYYSSLTSSCRATNYPLTTPSPAVVSSDVPTTSTCRGSSYAVKPTDTFHSVPKEQGVSTEQLLHSNRLSYNESAFPKSGSLCIENKCKTYVLKANETCDAIAETVNATTIQIMSWNLNVNTDCSNLNDFVGNTICVSNPLGDFAVPSSESVGAPAASTAFTTAAPRPTDTAPNVTTNCGQYYDVATGDDCSTITLKFGISLDDFRVLNPSINEGCTNLFLDYSYCVAPVGNIATYPGYNGTATVPYTLPPFTAGPSTSVTWDIAEPTSGSKYPVIPLANGTRVDCWQYLWINDTSTGPEATDCWGMASSAGVDREEMALWNPSLDENPTDSENPSYDYDCTLLPSVSYCIAVASPVPATPVPKAPPSPRASGEIDGCITWDAIMDGVACDVYLDNLGISLSDFYTMNPSVKSDCSGLYLGTYYCIATPDIPNYTDGDTTTSSSTPTTSGVGNGVVTPTPTQSGMTKSCKTFHKVVSGDTCYDIAAAASITLDDFYTWNPAVGSDCHALQLDFYVCIGVSMPSTGSPTQTTTSVPTSTGVAPPGPTQSGIAANCNKYVMQKDGVYCYDMAAAAGISLDDLYKWNPGLKGDCSGLWTGYAYCIGVSS